MRKIAYFALGPKTICARAMLLVFCGASFAVFPSKVQSGTPASEESAAETPGAPVEIDGRPIFPIYASVGGLSAEERAANIEKRLVGVARRRNIPVDSIHAEDRGAWTEILAGNDLILGVTEGDATAAGRSRTQLAAEYAEIIRRTVTVYREEHTGRVLLRGIVFTLMATAALVLALMILFRIRRAAKSAQEAWVRRTEQAYSRNSFRAQVTRYLAIPIVGAGVIAVATTIVALLEVYATRVLGFFPSTRYASLQMHRWTVSELGVLLNGLWGYLPDLVVVVVIIVAARYLIKLNDYIFSEIQQGVLIVRGFYPEWAEPTSKLVHLLILAGTAIVVFPYLPGSNSPAFRGISVFLGVLLSLGSTSAVSHGVAGTILTYMRSFNIGDFVKIGDSVGEVVEKTLLVTRIRTPKNEVVTIPNGTILGGVVVNYTAQARKNGVILHTQVSIGNNAPWERVHELLIAAALETEAVLKSQAPFVLQVKLDDFYVCYELNAFTDQPEKMQRIYSDLHQKIQDKFNQAGIEINSPHYASIRDGNRIAIPDQCIPKDYKDPAFAFREIKNQNAFPDQSQNTVSSKVGSPRT